MKTLNNLLNEVKEIAEGNKKELADCILKIEQTDTNYNSAEKELAIAENNVDPKKYAKAKEDMWTAKHTKELYLKQKEKLENNPIISKEKYSNILADVTLVANNEHELQNERAAKLVRELIDISKESSETYQTANEIMKILQYDVYKDADALVAANGHRITQTKSYNNTDTVHNFYNTKLQGTSLAKRAGNEPEVQKNRLWI